MSATEKYLDFHTHRFEISEPDVFSIFNLPLDAMPAEEDATVRFSAGLHPWNLTDEWRSHLPRLEMQLSDTLTITLGEAGLDRACTTPWPLQMSAFEAQVQLSEQHAMPLVLHCVRATDVLLAMHKSMRPSQPWILHGFRGKPQLAEQLLGQGLLLSFGEHFNAEALRLCPAGTFFLETDESELSIKDIYAKAAAVRSDLPTLQDLQTLLRTELL
jgi:TatD DNase family protein